LFITNGAHLLFIHVKFYHKKVKYAYQEFPHSEDTASPHSQEEDKEREREHG
jgi:hypothetical protein